MSSDFQVVAIRGTRVECTHRIHVAVTDADGRPIAWSGDPSHVTFWRSGAKPFQALALVGDGGAARFGITSQELAIICSSHSSEPRHIEVVRGLLEKIGCTEADLACGPHPPLSPAVARDYEARGVTLTAIHSNCSGKHAGMLALARHHGWPTRDYHVERHPVQERCLHEVAAWTGLAAREIDTGVDGCGVVCFALPIREMARAYAALMGPGGRSRTPGARTSPSGSTTSVAGARARVLDAMLRHPDLLAGTGRSCTEIMQAHPGKVVVKVGAGGVYSAGLIEEGYGITLKVEDGDGRAAIAGMAGVLMTLGYGGPVVEGLAYQEQRNTRGEPTGALRTIGTLAR